MQDYGVKNITEQHCKRFGLHLLFRPKIRPSVLFFWEQWNFSKKQLCWLNWLFFFCFFLGPSCQSQLIISVIASLIARRNCVFLGWDNQVTNFSPPCRCLISKAEVQGFIERCMIAVGTKPHHARSLAEVLVEGDHRGHYSHGLNRMGEWKSITLLHVWLKGSSTAVVVKKKKVVDGNLSDWWHLFSQTKCL